MNEAKLQQFMGNLVVDMGGAAMMANVVIGEELGLYRAMADGVLTTAEALAQRTDCHPRLVREWLTANAAAGYVEHVDGEFRLPEEQVRAFVLSRSPAAFICVHLRFPSLSACVTP